jgi:hypothetical protein
MTNTKNASKTKNSTPILIRISAIIILVVSIIGFLFFVTASIYQLFNPDFLQKISINNSQYSNLNTYVIVQSILHLGMFVSSLLILKLKKSGLFLFLFIITSIFIVEIISGSEFLISQITLGILISIIMILFYRKID